MTSSTIRFAPDILSRLGEELNPHPAFGIIELVKNSYDADAKSCVVTLKNIDKPGGIVTVTDDGDGMTLDQIRNGWLVLGHSHKSRKKRTRLGRLPAGSKGLGRLAALRLGELARLETRPRSDRTSSYSLLIDWSAFDSASLVDEVILDVHHTERDPKKRQGTAIRLINVRDRIGRREVKRLARAMLLLADPFAEDAKGFQPKLIAPEFTDLEELVSNRYFDNASYHLIASLDENGSGSARLLDFKGEELFSADHSDLTPNSDDEGFHCPPFEFELWTFILNRSTFASLSSTLGEVREWLSEFGGVHIYQNGIRVSPYGDPGHDWLSMNLSRVRSPEERPSTNNSIGRVKLLDEHEVLVQKTDRSGFIETPQFEDMRRFAQVALDWMAARRLEIAESRRLKARISAPKMADKSKKQLDATIKTAPKQIREQLQNAADRYSKLRDREVDELRKELQLYRTLSTAGITAATFAHESTGNPIKVIQASLVTVERRAREHFGKQYTAKMQAPLDRIKASVESLSVLDRATLSLLDHEKRRSSRVDVHRTIAMILKMFRPFFVVRNVEVETDLAEGSPWMHASEAAVESIITNLLNNSLTALESKPIDDRRIVVRTKTSEDVLILSVLDSGDGIRDIRMSDIWLPGRTTRKNGTGLGLTIVRDSAVDLGGRVGADNGSSLGGAEVFVELPIVGV